MRLAGRLSLLAAALTLAGCGSSHARRDAVNAYFTKVNAAEAHLLASIGEIDNAFRAFALSHNTPVEVQELKRAQNEIGSTLAGVRAIGPPADAAKVHGDLVRLLALQYAVAHELYWTTQFQPTYVRDLSGLQAAATAFTQGLNGVGKPGSGAKPPHLSAGALLTAYATAFSQYGASLEPVVDKIDRLSAPPELRPGFVAQRSALRRTVALCSTISSTLKAGHVAAANAAIAQLFETANAINGAAAQRGSRRAVAAYQAQLASIAKITAKVSHERQQLVTELG